LQRARGGILGSISAYLESSSLNERVTILVSLLIHTNSMRFDRAIAGNENNDAGQRLYGEGLWQWRIASSISIREIVPAS
jgi:hypothetical protein